MYDSPATSPHRRPQESEKVDKSKTISSNGPKYITRSCNVCLISFVAMILMAMDLCVKTRSHDGINSRCSVVVAAREVGRRRTRQVRRRQVGRLSGNVKNSGPMYTRSRQQS